MLPVSLPTKMDLFLGGGERAGDRAVALLERGLPSGGSFSSTRVRTSRRRTSGGGEPRRGGGERERER